jgi:hypothetical protein
LQTNPAIRHSALAATPRPDRFATRATPAASRRRADGGVDDGGFNQRRGMARLETVEQRRDELRGPHADAGAGRLVV